MLGLALAWQPCTPGNQLWQASELDNALLLVWFRQAQLVALLAVLAALLKVSALFRSQLDPEKGRCLKLAVAAKLQDRPMLTTRLQ